MTLLRSRFLSLVFSSLLVLGPAAPLLRAEDARTQADRVETTDGHVYTGVVIQRKLPDRIVFMHAEGAATVALDKLTPETLRQLHLDKAEAAPGEDAKKDDEIERLRRDAAADRAAREAAKDEDASSNSDHAGEREGSLTGAWTRDMGKGQIGVKIYGFGRVSTAVYDSKGKVINHNGGTWRESGVDSVEKIQFATDGWSNLVGRTIHHEVKFLDSKTVRLIWDKGGVEEWTRMP